MRMCRWMIVALLNATSMLPLMAGEICVTPKALVQMIREGQLSDYIRLENFHTKRWSWQLKQALGRGQLLRQYTDQRIKYEGRDLQERVDLLIGSLDPVESIAEIQKRLFLDHRDYGTYALHNLVELPPQATLDAMYQRVVELDKERDIGSISLRNGTYISQVRMVQSVEENFLKLFGNELANSFNGTGVGIEPYLHHVKEKMKINREIFSAGDRKLVASEISLIWGENVGDRLHQHFPGKEEFVDILPYGVMGTELYMPFDEDVLALLLAPPRYSLIMSHEVLHRRTSLKGRRLATLIIYRDFSNAK